MKIFFVLVIVGAIAAATMVVNMISRGFSARTTPSAIEVAAARFLRDTGIPRAAKETPNPWKTTPEIVAAGRAHWADHCATCHANDGSGNTVIGQNLYPKAPDMRLPATQNLTDGELYYIIRNGVRLTGMPAWGDPNLKRDDESWHLVAFIRHLPQITPEEVQDMQRLNPKTEADRDEEREEEEFLGGAEPAQQPPGQPAATQHHP